MVPPNPRLKINREELAWAAGFFDGEGHIRYGEYRNTSGGIKSTGMRTHIPQIDPRPLQRFQAAVLGIGIIDGPRRSLNPNHSAQWLWRAASFEDVQAVIAPLWTFPVGA